RQYQYDARRQQGDGGGVFGDSQFTSTLSVNFHFPKIPRRTKNEGGMMPPSFYCKPRWIKAEGTSTGNSLAPPTQVAFMNN
ncbi:hypothetical protein ACEUCS_19505, partial [Aeromonas caviae]